MKKPAYFSDISGDLIPEGERAQVTVTMDNQKVSFDTMQTEVERLRPPKPKKTVRVRIAYPESATKQAQVFDLPMDDVKKYLPLDGIPAQEPPRAQTPAPTPTGDDDDAALGTISDYIRANAAMLNTLYKGSRAPGAEGEGFTATKLVPLVSAATGGAIGEKTVKKLMPRLVRDGVIEADPTPIRGGGTLYRAIT